MGSMNHVQNPAATPAPGKTLRGFLGLIVVSGHENMATRADFPDGLAVVWNFLQVFIQHPSVGEQLAETLSGFDLRAFVGGQSVKLRLPLADRQERAGIGEPIRVHDPRAQTLHALDHLRRWPVAGCTDSQSRNSDVRSIAR